MASVNVDVWMHAAHFRRQLAGGQGEEDTCAFVLPLAQSIDDAACHFATQSERFSMQSMCNAQKEMLPSCNAMCTLRVCSAGYTALAMKKDICNYQGTTASETGSSTTVVKIGRYLSTERGSQFNEH